ncbi:MAG: arsenate reductase (glutaredoxin) [Lentisphaerae bacterium]|jgi:arsenate reductase (glutaredoxin)|nr:arsenate reductase (glutaredoxin) [Lentisphaerota bacterium]MBT4817892.1 arsenate reductase (glutaredoxin) [Lentisphaerota bacterium]MBT5605398.1 arsenate reductase (glutaredoxin) [Lentisphaerota bacterium]MBT7062022.1 arsenate reductase (glutaredoxin) [Lentisphaerota bacterium]MBT7848608.1 arsenate reductase (glutaredoxin) [Lentisphaerota bacterium]
MSQIEILHNARCSKSRKTLEILTDRGSDPEIIEYLQEPLSADDIRLLASKLGLRPSQFLRKGEYAELGIVAAETEDGIVRQMEQYPILIERPIVINGDKARIGRPPESVLEIL